MKTYLIVSYELTQMIVSPCDLLTQQLNQRELLGEFQIINSLNAMAYIAAHPLLFPEGLGTDLF